jgi:hypothetical protein
MRIGLLAGAPVASPSFSGPTVAYDAICARTVYARLDGVELSVDVSIAAPVPDPKQTNWWCSIRLVGLGSLITPPRTEWRVAGYDSFQALTLALEHVVRILDQTGLKRTAFPETELASGFAGEPDDAFPRMLAANMPTAFRLKMERVVRSATEEATRSGEMRGYYIKVKHDS